MTASRPGVAWLPKPVFVIAIAFVFAGLLFVAPVLHDTSTTSSGSHCTSLADRGFEAEGFDCYTNDSLRRGQILEVVVESLIVAATLNRKRTGQIIGSLTLLVVNSFATINGLGVLWNPDDASRSSGLIDVVIAVAFGWFAITVVARNLRRPATGSPTASA